MVITDQEGKEYTKQQAAHYQSFKLDLMGEGGVPLSDREEPESHFRKQSGKTSYFSQRILGGLLLEGNAMDRPAEVPLHQCTQHEK